MSPWSIERFDELPSTNQHALALAEQGAPEGTVVVARRQTAGRGRHGRPWHSPEGGLWFTVVLRPTNVEGLSLLGALASVQVAREQGVEAGILWPNDVVVGPRKLGGVLSEGRFLGGRPEYAVLGIGLNVHLEETDFPEELAGSATSLLRETGRRFDLDRMLEDLLGRLSASYALHQSGGLGKLLPEILGRCVFLGQGVRLWTPQGEHVGRASGLNAEGALVLQDGTVFYSADRLELLGG